MRSCVVTFLLVIASTLHASSPLGWDLEMTGAEYENAVVAHGLTGIGNVAPSLNEIMTLGKRNLEWLRVINSARSPKAKLSFTSRETQQGYPVESPRTYNEKLILSEYEAFKADLPQAMARILFSKDDLPKVPPIDEKEYLIWGLAVDRKYQIAMRWKTLSPYIPQLRLQAAYDVRGYLYLKAYKNLKDSLTSWDSLGEEVRKDLRAALVTQWQNSVFSSAVCSSELKSSIGKKDVWGFHQKYQPRSASHYENFFALKVKRRDAQWAQDDLSVVIPFLDPRSADVKKYLGNIEDEWKAEILSGKWFQLKLNFQTASRGSIPYVDFQSGVTPHVNGLGGNQIVMDANQPLDEYDSQWTIRHEFGHVIGFPDCYIEFYDDSIEAITGYQLDITNLMCSRRGVFQIRHYDELVRVYTK